MNDFSAAWRHFREKRILSCKIVKRVQLYNANEITAGQINVHAVIFMFSTSVRNIGSNGFSRKKEVPVLSKVDVVNKNGTAKTGDSNDMAMYLMLLMMSMSCTAFIVYRKKQEEEQQ